MLQIYLPCKKTKWGMNQFLLLLPIFVVDFAEYFDIFRNFLIELFERFFTAFLIENAKLNFIDFSFNVGYKSYNSGGRGGYHSRGGDNDNFDRNKDHHEGSANNYQSRGGGYHRSEFLINFNYLLNSFNDLF